MSAGPFFFWFAPNVGRLQNGRMNSAPPAWRFVPEELDAGNLAELEQLFAELSQRDLLTVEDLCRWLEDESELQARIAAEKARRYIRKTCYTDDEIAKERYLAMERDVMPRVKVLGDALDGKFLDCDLRDQLPPSGYEVLIRQRKNAKEIFREANTELQARESELQTRQQSLLGGLVVRFEGREHTPQQMAPYFLDQDRALRSRAHAALLAARRETWDPLNDIYDELLGLRQQMAENAGFDTYTPFRFRQLQRFDYGPDLCSEFHDAVEQVVVPAVARLDETRRTSLGIETLRPYDLEVDLEGREPFRPFDTEQQLLEIVSGLFSRIDSRFADEFGILRREQLLDLMSRKGKAPGGYQYALEDLRLPFIFCNSVGTHQDVQTLLHEGGHAFHSILSRHHSLLSYRRSPTEFAETASMSMELMGLEELAGVYGEDEARRTRRRHLEGLLRVLEWIATIDSFQHWIYANPGHDRAAREAHWLSIMDRFEPSLDYTGFEDARTNRWTAQTHLFNHPFYYIEYGIAQIAALQIWQAYRRDPVAAVHAYRSGLALGGSRPLPELFAAAGGRFEVSAGMLSSLVADIEELLV